MLCTCVRICMPIGRTMLTTKQQALVSTLTASFNARYCRNNTPVVGWICQRFYRHPDGGGRRIKSNTRLNPQKKQTRMKANDRIPLIRPPRSPFEDRMATTREKRTCRTYYNTTSADELYIAGCFPILLDYRSVDRIGRPISTHTQTHAHKYIHPSLIRTCSYLLFEKMHI